MHFLTILPFFAGIVAANTALSGVAGDKASINSSNNNKTCNAYNMLNLDRVFRGVNNSVLEDFSNGIKDVWKEIRAVGIFDGIDEKIVETIEDGAKELWDTVTGTPDDHTGKRVYGVSRRSVTSVTPSWNATSRINSAGRLRPRDGPNDGKTLFVDFENFDLKELLDLIHNTINIKVFHGCLPIKCIAALGPAANACGDALYTAAQPYDPQKKVDPFIYTGCYVQIFNTVANLPKPCHECLYGVIHAMEKLLDDDTKNNKTWWENVKTEVMSPGEDNEHPAQNETKENFWDKVKHKFTGVPDGEKEGEKKGGEEDEKERDGGNVLALLKAVQAVQL